MLKGFVEVSLGASVYELASIAVLMWVVELRVKEAYPGMFGGQAHRHMPGSFMTTDSTVWIIPPSPNLLK